MTDAHAEIAEVLFSEQEIQDKIAELAKSIDEDYRGKELLLVGVLKGAVMVMADLARALETPVSMEFMAVSSYGSSTSSSGVVRILKDLDTAIEGRHVLIVEDIIDSGLTLNYIVEHLRNRNPASIMICALLNTPSRRRVDVKIDYHGFDIPDEFVVGYGLDFRQRYRNVPFVGVLKPETYTAHPEE